MFFSAAAQCNDHRPGITKDTPDFRHRGEAGEAVNVLESLEFAHPRIVTSFRPCEKYIALRKNRDLAILGGRKLPTRFPEEPSMICPIRSMMTEFMPSCSSWYVLSREMTSTPGFCKSSSSDTCLSRVIRSAWAATSRNFKSFEVMVICTFWAVSAERLLKSSSSNFVHGSEPISLLK